MMDSFVQICSYFSTARQRTFQHALQYGKCRLHGPQCCWGKQRLYTCHLARGHHRQSTCPRFCAHVAGSCGWDCVLHSLLPCPTHKFRLLLQLDGFANIWRPVVWSQLLHWIFRGESGFHHEMFRCALLLQAQAFCRQHGLRCGFEGTSFCILAWHVGPDRGPPLRRRPAA